MTDRVGRSPGTEVPDVGNGLWERVRDAVQAETGADASLWNGDLRYTDPERRVRGSASADGTLRLSQTRVVEPLQEMYEQRGLPSTELQRVERRSALKTVGHEFSHLVASAGHDHDARLAGMRQPEYKPIEEGVTEAWSHSQVDRLADRALPPDLAAEVKSVRGPQSYPGWAPAARSFAEEVGAEVGLDGDEVLRRMNKEARTEKARVAADLLFESSSLPDLVPEGEREAVRDQIRSRIDRGFADLTPLNTDKSVNRRAVSSAQGIKIAEAASEAVRSAESRYRAAPGRAVGLEQKAPAQDLSAFPPPKAADRLPQVPAPGGRAQPGSSQPTAEPDREVAALRAVLAHQAPAAGAPRVPQGQATRGRSPGTGGRGAERPTGRSGGDQTPSR